MSPDAGRPKWRLSLRDCLFLGFCAVFVIFTRAVLRLHLGIPGHSMLFMVFFLLLARGCIGFKLAASLTGLLAGTMAVILGIGKGGPLIAAKFIIPGLAIDGFALLLPGLFESFILCAGVGSLAAGTRFVNVYFVDRLVGMDQSIALQHALFNTVMGMLFGLLGSLFVPPVIKKLRAFGIIQRT